MTTSNGKPPIRIQDKLLISAVELALLFGCSREQVYTMQREGIIPRATIRFSEKFVRWRAQEVIDWLASGAPSAHHWIWEPTKLPNVTKLLRQRSLDLQQPTATKQSTSQSAR